MTFLTPVWLLVGAIAAAAVVALHLLNRRRLRTALFPTARFVPEAPLRAVSPALLPTDIPLMLLRFAIVSLIAVAMARPVGPSARRAVVIALADRSPATDSADVTRMLTEVHADTVIEIRNLSAGLVAARRAAMRWKDRADSAELVVASSLSAGLWDAATEALRAGWPGRIRLVQTGRRKDGETGGPVRIVWPEATVALSDTASGVYTAGAAMVGRFRRIGRWTDSRMSGRPIAWFTDGAPAVLEYPTASGCERVVGFLAPEGDALIRSAGLRFAERLAAPCEHGWTPDKFLAADSAVLDRLAGRGPLASTAAFPSTPTAPTLIPLILAFILLGAERYLRRRTA